MADPQAPDTRDYRLGKLCQDLGVLPVDLGSLLSAHGLHICSEAEQRVLDACASLVISTDAIGPVSMNGKPQICSSTSGLAAAEYSRRQK